MKFKKLYINLDFTIIIFLTREFFYMNWNIIQETFVLVMVILHFFIKMLNNAIKITVFCGIQEIAPQNGKINKKIFVLSRKALEGGR